VLITSLIPVVNKLTNLLMARGRGRPCQTHRMCIHGLGNTWRPIDL
jgi:hypothetical protein